MSYSTKNTNSSKGGLFFLILLIVVALLIGFFLIIQRVTGEKESELASTEVQKTESRDGEGVNSPASQEAKETLEPKVEASLGTQKNPVKLLESLQQAISDGTTSQFLKSLDLDGLSESERQTIINFGDQSQSLALRQVGVLEFDKEERWALEGADGSVMYIDVEKSADGIWKIANVYRSEAADGKGALADGDALSTADIFIKTLLEQDFEKALQYVDPATISDAQIAGLCIMFEEGKYTLNPSKPLNSLFQREGVAAFTVNLIESTSQEKAQIELALEKNNSEEPWLVSELNIEKLLKSYITQVSGGDTYYTPIIKNPQGGDRLALYFDFNEGELTTRAKSQLDIIAALLKTNSDKKLTLSGHADAIGSDGYNNSLSLERAESVNKYLISRGLKGSQIHLSAFGESMPRRDNETDQGRRANRRTEIYLDF